MDPKASIPWKLGLKAGPGGQESQPATNRHPVQGEGGEGPGGLELCDLYGLLRHQGTLMSAVNGNQDILTCSLVTQKS